MNTIITHKKCVDGFVSARILASVYPEARVLRVGHDDDELRNLEPAEGQIFCDITPPKARAADFFAAGAIVLDHHKSNKEIFDLPNVTSNSIYADEPGASGAVLALAHAMSTHNMEIESGVIDPHVFLGTLATIVRLVGIYDTWVEGDPAFENACRAHAVLELLSVVEPDLAIEKLVENWHHYGEFGRMLFARAEADAREAAEQAEVVTYVGTPGASQGFTVAYLRNASHGPAVINRAATHLESLHPHVDVMVAGLDRPSDTRTRVSLRARKSSTIDCSAVAARLAGGGHKGAAGFSVQGGRKESLEALLGSLVSEKKH